MSLQMIYVEFEGIKPIILISSGISFHLSHLYIEDFFFWNLLILYVIHKN